MNIAALIDHTLLKPEATAADIARLCCEAREFAFWSVCVNPCHAGRAAAALAGPARSAASSNVKVCTVIGFPLGANLTEMKVYETRFALRDGASEIDMVINIGALKAGDDAVVLADLQSVMQACRESDARCKVIFETCLLTNDEKVRACELCVKAGVDFVKTSTGFSTGGATVEDVALMSRLVKPHRIGVKASGGIRTLADLKTMVAAGATRIGTSHGVKIMQETGAAS